MTGTAGQHVWVCRKARGSTATPHLIFVALLFWICDSTVWRGGIGGGGVIVTHISAILGRRSGGVSKIVNDIGLGDGGAGHRHRQPGNACSALCDALKRKNIEYGMVSGRHGSRNKRQRRRCIIPLKHRRVNSRSAASGGCHRYATPQHKRQPSWRR